jgi:hypothetical protein
MEAPVRFALSACLAVAVVGWLGLMEASGQATVTLPTAMPPSGAPCPCGPGSGCQCQQGAAYAPGMVYQPGMMYAPGTAMPPGAVVMPGAPGAACAPGTPCAPVTSDITTWDPYSASQGTVVSGVPCPQPAMMMPCAPRTYRFGIFGEYLFLRAGESTTIDYAVPINGAIVPPVEPTLPVGPIATLNQDYESGFRVGGWWQRTCESQIAFSYTHYDSQTEDSVTIDPADNIVLLPVLVHPATVAADSFFTDAAAQYDLEYRAIDIEYKHVMISDCMYRVHYLVGARYLHYDEEFGAQYTNATTIETVQAENDFEGIGLRGGFEGEWGGVQGGLLAYGKLIGGAIAGELTSSYTQANNFDGVVVLATREDDRIVPSIEVEAGIGWRSRNQRWRLSAGYNITALFNLASANSLIQSVRSGQFSDNDDTFTLDGLVARAEFAF